MAAYHFNSEREEGNGKGKGERGKGRVEGEREGAVQMIHLHSSYIISLTRAIEA